MQMVLLVPRGLWELPAAVIPEQQAQKEALEQPAQERLERRERLERLGRPARKQRQAHPALPASMVRMVIQVQPDLLVLTALPAQREPQEQPVLPE